MTNETSVTSTSGNSTLLVLGRVKWFNNKVGYGFITATNGDMSGSDIFVHHSKVNVSSEQYKYLVQGEYVEFSVEKTEGGSHEYQAGNVSGINGGKLMCETRNEFRQTRLTYKDAKEDENVVVPSTPRPPVTSQDSEVQQSQQSQQSRQAPRPRARKPVPSEGGPEWTLVKKENVPKKSVVSKPRSKPAPAAV